MIEKQDLLIEIGTEELPPKALDRLARAFSTAIQSQLEQQGLAYESVRRYATPRRLALLVLGLDSAQADRSVERRGPAIAAAFDASGGATQAAMGFARSCGVEVEQLQRLETPKGEWLVFRRQQQGAQTLTLVPPLVDKALDGLPIPKRMRWGNGPEEFVRPVHWVLMLFGNSVVHCKVLGVPAGRETRGHRFHHPGPLQISTPSEYAAVLQREGRVVADFDERREIIRGQVTRIATDAGYQAVVDEELLDEVTALVEWPVAVMGGFEERFLEVPAEALVKAMQEHQKYFPVVDEEGQLKPHFITVSNIDSRDVSQVRFGNERVIRPRFSDAAFFWEQDLKQPLESRRNGLKDVVFQQKLGTLFEKSRRISQLARSISETLGFDAELAERAADLSKCDLLSEMVGEFPSLQGTMGRYYAAKGGELPDVAAALEEQYLPRHAGDALPATYCGRAIAIADRLDTLVGIFAIGQRPSGVKDPFGLRRAALGVLRILIETPLELDLERLLNTAAEGLTPKVDAGTVVGEVFDYMMERLRAYYSDREIPSDVIEAVLARRPTRPADFDLRVRAVSEFRSLPEAESLAAANKRIRNILRKTEEAFSPQPDIALLSEPSEKALAAQIEELTPEVEPLFGQGRYTEALQRLARLRPAVDSFFDNVMVMCEEASLRKNRLALLQALSALFLKVADISMLQKESK